VAGVLEARGDIDIDLTQSGILVRDITVYDPRVYRATTKRKSRRIVFSLAMRLHPARPLIGSRE